MFKSEKKIKLPYKLAKVLHCCPALNESYVIMGIKSPGKQCVLHVSKNGHLIAQKEYVRQSLFPFAVITEKQLLFLRQSKGLITQWNLQTHEFLQVPFSYNNNCDTHEIIVFHNTNTFCLYQCGGPNSNTFKLSYFQYPLADKQASPFHVYEINNANIWTYDYHIRRSNNDSQIVWFKSNHQDLTEFKTYNLIHKQVKTHQMATRIEQKKFNISIGNIWQVKQGQYMINSVTDRQKSINQVYANNIFVCNNEDKQIRQSKFRFPGKHQLQICNAIPFGSNSMFRTFEFKGGKAVQSPVYYISHETESIIYEDKWVCSNLSKFQQVGYDSGLLVESIYKNAEVQQVTVILIKIINVKEAAVMFLLDFVENCDEDLLREVVELIKNQQ